MNYIFYKNILDRVFAIIFILILFPLFITIPFLNLILNGNPVFFVQNRSGKNKKSIKLIKLRTIKEDNSDISKVRYTIFGSFLRKSGLDEIFQLFNIIYGDLSFVGPRPLYEKYNDLYNSKQIKRLNIKPGLTGLAQIKQHNHISWEEKIEYDLQYMDSMSLMSDIKIIYKTITLLCYRMIDKKFIPISEEFKGSKSDD